MGKRFSRGETLVETLTAILLVTLASLMMVRMCLSGIQLNQSARERENAFRGERNAAELCDPLQSSPGEVSIRGGGREETYEVRVVGGEGRLTSYSLVKEGR
ncbi:hypothetical protein KQI82_11555 [Oscillibacter sp. MSJ-2]|uniref:Type II secretion system protein n=1 Tax=Dysosmobacter acutus TaxID=2841504 RepID=A0ABS6FB78_9FIRM|nr:hypothetical protein [Dysosmobacter acutus]MBU5627546.1 hypothetical protein [Dysosmobacter acutus]